MTAREPGIAAIGRDARGWWLVGVEDPDSPEQRFATAEDFALAVAERERASAPRWVLEGQAIIDTLLAHGVRLARCHDLGLVGRVLATRGDAEELALTGGSAALLGASAGAATAPPPPADVAALFDFDEGAAAAPDSPATVLARAHRQRAIASGSLATLAALESAGRLIATELRAAGIPFDAQRHDAVLHDLIGERDYSGRPVKLEAAAQVVRGLLREPRLNLDSPRDVLAALRRAGLDVRSTSAWELREHAHPVIEPLLHYKHLSRLFTANGWAWRDAWVRDGRLRTEYVPGGVVTGRWATSGGGALQLPREIRSAVVADPEWRLVVADAAQLEPRILAAMSGDARMAAAGQARDLYQAFVDAGVVPTRQDAKIGLLGAMYGGTRGRSGELLPALRRAYPAALRFVESAARAGERGEQVATHLGRFSPWPPEAGIGSGSDTTSASRSWGRFTRNFVVQGTAAEWALAWLARIRQRIAGLEPTGRRIADAPLTDSAHLVYFLHDEIVVHAPAHLAEAVAHEVEAAAAWAGRELFPGAPVAFPVTAGVVEVYGDAK